ncbi:Spore germination protein B3 precursor [Caloramator mitchellensis]|uniref:Spore germination protein B3 n=1 Tax=Caloramator mitchellensis TaxID=908809 RepID=A0A0R3JUW4_CALMK|nr:Ger(x)C family spore germination protein [Caloramator mitchellensis]KRQ87366.1 Spore germination protein B3 precursor [Caloramator mitchellensis]
MKLVKIIILTLIVLLYSSCWNYREIDKIAPAAGISFDYDEDKNVYSLTVEIVTLKTAENGIQQMPEYFTSEGETIFDAVRNIIAKSGKKIYWAHSKTVYISEKIAKRGIIDVLDFIERDAEVRSDMKIVLVKGKKAGDIFKAKTESEKIVSFHIDEILENSRSVSKYPNIELWDLINQIQSDASAAILPVAYIVEDFGKEVVKLSGCALLKKAKLIGFLDERDTKNLLFLNNKLYGGIIPIRNVLGTNSNVSFEIYNSKTKVNPKINDGKITFYVVVSIDVSLAEISGEINFIEEKNLEKLKEFAEEYIEKDIQATFYKIRDIYALDVFGFSKNTKIKYPKFWKESKNEWVDIFMSSSIDVSVNLNIFGSATTNDIIKVGK